LISQILPLSENNKDDKSGLSKKQDDEILTGLLSYLENNIQQTNQPDSMSNAKVKELNFIKTQIQRYIETSKDQLTPPDARGKLLDVMASFGKMLPDKRLSKNMELDTRQTTRCPPGESHGSQNQIDIKKFESLENKYNDLLKLNEETQLQIQQIKRDTSMNSITKMSRGFDFLKQKKEKGGVKKDDLFNKMHEASIEMEVNRESKMFSTQTGEDSKKPEIEQLSEFSKKPKKISGSSEYIYTNIEKIYKNEDKQNLSHYERESVKLSGED
jgi:hypothetical protein